MTVKEGVIKFGLVGCGRIGARHAKIISEENNAQLVAVCDLKKPDLGDPLNHIPFYYSIDEMLKAHPEMDVVSIATPNGLHASQAIIALEHGRHVIIEKPIALRKADAEKVIYTALHKSRHVFGVMQNRYSPPSVWIKDLVMGGKLGRINMVQVNCYWNRMRDTIQDKLGTAPAKWMAVPFTPSLAILLILCIGSSGISKI